MDKYKEMRIRLTLMNDKNWVKAIGTLKTLEFDNEKKDYTVVYKKEKQRKNSNFRFNKVEYVEETYTFIFTNFKSGEDGLLTEKVNSREVIMDIEIIDFKIEDKQDFSMYGFIG
ncbi:hypothetical protein [Clostridium tagluense]|uniref:hypothetical protein n=1 Tax=Clostridium tagluense TaxID=360422 RepID=UPI001CF1F4B7|nr:hypothetical protein [Clostridium tagluense]MCB2297066.1 hypothetical protein [Clostridium tagluense]